MTANPRCAILPVAGHLGLYAVLSPHAAHVIDLMRAVVIVDHARNLHYLTQARRKVPMRELDAGARLVQLGLSEDNEIVCLPDAP